jgi:hypothetical protein
MSVDFAWRQRSQPVSELFQTNLNPGSLRTGLNVLAVEIHPVNGQS